MEDEPSRHKNLGTERNRDHVSKRETPQWEEVTLNPSIGKETYRNQGQKLRKPRDLLSARKSRPKKQETSRERESRMKHTRGAERQDPDATASTSERRKLQMTRTGKEEPRMRETARE